MTREATSLHLQGITELTLTAPLKQGWTPAPDTCTYVTRLQLLLKTVSEVQGRSRELESGSAFSDVVARVSVIHSFRLAILEAENKLLLAVTFDRPWEPYIRQVWRDLGALLDVIFCHCDGYPIARDCTFDDYVAWIRRQQVQGNFFYIATGLTAGDLSYSIAMEKLQRENPPSAAIDMAATQFVIPRAEDIAARAALLSPAQAARKGLEALAGLYRLTEVFAQSNDPMNRDHIILHRAAQDFLIDLKNPTIAAEFPDGSPLRKLYDSELLWFGQTPAPALPSPAERLEFKPTDVQGGILRGYPKVTHGCLVLIKADDAASARAFLHDLPVRDAVDVDENDAGPFVNVALTLQGLQRLGLSDAEIAVFPKEFREGMEARAGLLGDVRANHPERWNLPKHVDRLSDVHIVVQLRIGEATLDEKKDHTWHDVHPLHDTVHAWKERKGISVLAVEPMRRYEKEAKTRDHFGFADGLSQPEVGAKDGKDWSDAVQRGEILIGYDNDQGDGPRPKKANPLLDNSTFLVVRKLKQNVKALNERIGAQAVKLKDAGVSVTADELKAKMMGRTLDGDPVVAPGARESNDFNYDADPKGAKCPFQSHVRRTNPRPAVPGATPPLPRQKMPRLMRRGMTYGAPMDSGNDDDDDRGLMFMAYNASIAEQFEVVQRWISGGNSSGVHSSQADPFLGVPRTGDPRTFRFQHEGKVLRVNLDEPASGPSVPPIEPVPFVKLEWGAYLFVPSMAALAKLGEPPTRAPVSALASTGEQVIQKLLATPTVARAAGFKAALEDVVSRKAGIPDAIWAAVREIHGGALDTQSDFGVLVGSDALVNEVYGNASAHHTVDGYMQRMKTSIGPIFLGLDAGDKYEAQSKQVNEAIGKITRQAAFDAAIETTRGVLEVFVKDLPPSLLEGAPVDLKLLSDRVLAGLSRKWFDIPDNINVSDDPRTWNWHVEGEKPRCPGHFTSPSRYFFSPLPDGTQAEAHGQAHGKAVVAAVLKFVKAQRGHALRGELSKAMFDAISDDDQLASTIVGVMMGFLPTVDGNLRRTLYEWIEQRTLWSLQREARLCMHNGHISLDCATQRILPLLLHSMQRHPVPDVVWRRALTHHTLGPLEVQPGQRVVVGIVSATQALQAHGSDDVYPVFGGDRKLDPHPTHACPGYEMAMGVLLGILGALIERRLSPGSSPQVLVVG